MKKFLSVLMCIALVFTMSVPVFAADNDVDYAITNPYDDVDWATYNAYKADLHSHTNASDGDNTLKEMVERHYELGFDIHAISDHGTVNYSWIENNSYDPTIKLIMMVKEGKSALVVPGAAGVAANGINYTVENVDGDEYYSQEGGKAMLRVPYANEQNPTSLNNAHVNTWFVDFGHGRLGGTSDYESVISAVDELGGVSVINHPGEYTSARDELLTAEAYSNSKYGYYIDKFENLLINYDSCLGIDINSKGDSRTRFDRKLWDIMLSDLAPAGRNVYAIASTDAHNLEIADSGYVMTLMPENTSAALKDCLLSGNFFAQSCYVGNVDELLAYSEALLASGDAKAMAVGQAMKAVADETLADIADGDKGSSFRFEEGATCVTVNEIAVDDADDTITVNADDALYIRWISDGKVVAEGATIDLDECDSIGSYVRAEIISEGAVTYTQAFLLEYDGMPEADINEEFKDVDAGLLAFVDNIVRALGKVISTIAAPLLETLGVV